MINRLSNPINRNRSAAKISKVMSSSSEGQLQTEVIFLSSWQHWISNSYYHRFMIWTTLSWISVNLIPRWVGAGRSPTPIHPSQEKYNRKELLKPSRPDLLLIYSVSPTHLLLRRGVRSGVQLSCTETRFQKCSQSGKNGSKHPMLSILMANNVNLALELSKHQKYPKKTLHSIAICSIVPGESSSQFFPKNRVFSKTQ